MRAATLPPERFETGRKFNRWVHLSEPSRSGLLSFIDRDPRPRMDICKGVSASFTLALVQSKGVPKAVELILHTPADMSAP